MKKFVLSVIAICLSAGVLAASACGRGSSGIEQSLKDLRSADSFSVECESEIIFRCSGDVFYWKNMYGDSYPGEYCEYYFLPDGDGKYWVYEQEFNADQWTRQALTAPEYYSYYYMIKSGFGAEESFMQLIDLICMDFSALVTYEDGKYTLIDGLYYGELSFRQDGGDMIFETGYDGDTVRYTVSGINSTEIRLPASLSQAETGEVRLP